MHCNSRECAVSINQENNEDKFKANQGLKINALKRSSKLYKKKTPD